MGKNRLTLQRRLEAGLDDSLRDSRHGFSLFGELTLDEHHAGGRGELILGAESRRSVE